jgi:hypothetical protein
VCGVQGGAVGTRHPAFGHLTFRIGRDYVTVPVQSTLGRGGLLCQPRQIAQSLLSIGAFKPRVESATLSCSASGKISTRSEPRGEEGSFVLKRRKNSSFLRAFKGGHERARL